MAETIIPKEEEKLPKAAVVPGEEDEDDEDEGEGKEGEGRYSDPQPKDTVSLKKYLKVKDKVKTLQEELAASRSPVTATAKQLAEKFDIEEALAVELVNLAKQTTLEEFTAKYGSVIREQEEAKIEAAFDKEWQKVLAAYPQLAAKREQIRASAFTPKYSKTPLLDIVTDFYGDVLGKKTTEEAKPGADLGDGEKLDFANLTPEQKKAVLKDPALKKQYYAYRDSIEF